MAYEGLDLPIRIDLEEWEASLASLDAPLQNKIRQLKSEASLVDLQYKVEISGAKAAGDSIKALDLEMERLQKQYEIQEATVKGLGTALVKQIALTGEDSTEVKALSRELLKQANIYNNLEIKMNSLASARKAEAEREAQAARIAKERIEAEKKALDKSNIGLEYDVKISGAKAAGDNIKAYNLELQKLQKTYDIQKAQAASLTEQIKNQVKVTGLDSVEVRKLRNELLKVNNAMNKTQIQINSMNTGWAEKLVNSLSNISPTFAKATAEVTKYKAELSSLGSIGAVIGGAGLGAGIAIGITKSIVSAGEAIDGVAKAAADANEPVYLLAERFEMTYEEAEKLHGIMAIDGTNAEAFAKSMQKLNKELMSGGTGVASQMLRKYNVELQNADGTQKSYIEQTKALADAYQKAKEAGEGLNFVTATLGSSGSQFVHLLNGFDDYLAKYEEVNAKAQKDYKISHELLDAKKANIEAQRQYAAALGEAYTPAALAGQREENTLLKRRTELMDENNEEMKKYRDSLANVSIVSARISQGLGFVWDNIKQKAVGALGNIANTLGLVTEQERKAAMATSEATKKATTTSPKVDPAELDKARKKIETAYGKISREFDDIGASEYEKQINRLKDEVKAYEEAGVDKLTVEELFYAKKAELDRRFAENEQRKNDADAQKRRDAESAITTIFQSETEKRITAIEKQRQAWIKAGADEINATRAAQKQISDVYKQAQESRLSEAERTLQQNAKLARFISKEKEKGNENWQVAAEEYQRKMYLKNLGVRERDIQNVASIGVDKLNAITSKARETALAPITNNLTVNFDNVIVEDMGTMQKLADKVSDVITPTIERAMRGESQYGY